MKPNRAQNIFMTGLQECHKDDQAIYKALCSPDLYAGLLENARNGEYRLDTGSDWIMYRGVYLMPWSEIDCDIIFLLDDNIDIEGI